MNAPVGSTGQSGNVLLVDSSGAGITGKNAATFPALSYSLEGPHADVAWPALVDLAAITDAWTAGGIKERGDGEYRLDFPDAIYSVFARVTLRVPKASGVLVYPPIQVGGDLRLLDADIKIDKTTVPWSVVYYAKGTATEILRKRLFDVDAANLVSTDTVPGRAIQ